MEERIHEKMKNALVSAVTLLVAASAIGMVFNALRPAGIPFAGDWSPRAVIKIHAGDLEIIHIEDAFALMTQKKALFIDARDRDSFASGHIPDSVNISPDEAVQRQDEVRALLKSGRTLIAYCYDVDCPLGSDLAKRLGSLGIGPIKVMPEGWTGWMDRGYPFE